MSTTNDTQIQLIEVYDSNKNFLGYVSKISGMNGMLVCNIVDWKCKMVKKRAKSVLSSAKSAVIYIAPDKKKYYRQKENFTFKMIDA